MPKKWNVHYYTKLKLLDGEIPIPNVFSYFGINVFYDHKKFLVVCRPDNFCSSIIPIKTFRLAVEKGYRLQAH